MRVRLSALAAMLTCFCGGTLHAQIVDSAAHATAVLFGDVNLGRAVGQEILRGDTGYPFRYVKDSLGKADIVFVNLESQLSEQRGETQHPKNNLIFCGPPAGALSLKNAHVSVVSVANNHAYDYGRRALRETIQNLDSVGIACVGTSIDSVDSFAPVVLERSGIRIGFLAYAQFMNFKGSWPGHVALFDEQHVARDVASLRTKADFIIVSYHGGTEYVDAPPASVRRDFRTIADAGADIVVGHHPHYVQGIEWYNKSLLAFSLGNFVFYQPQHEWTQMGLGMEFVLARHDSSVTIDRARLVAVRAGLQPTFDLSADEEQMFFQRLVKLSRAGIYQKNGSWFVQVRANND